MHARGALHANGARRCVSAQQAVARTLVLVHKVGALHARCVHVTEQSLHTCVVAHPCIAHSRIVACSLHTPHCTQCTLACRCTLMSLHAKHILMLLHTYYTRVLAPSHAIANLLHTRVLLHTHILVHLLYSSMLLHTHYALMSLHAHYTHM